MARLTTHVLDTMAGCPAEGVRITLYRINGADREQIAEQVTNADGRCDAPLLEGDAFESGTYALAFHIGDYFAGKGVEAGDPAFLNIVPIRVGLNGDENYHVPLLVSPFAYSTYRGS